MQDYKYISIPVSYLEKHNISKRAFMQDTPESKKLLKAILENFPPYIELKNTFLINSSFILALGNKKDIYFNNAQNFENFCDFIKKSNFEKSILINEEKKEISVTSDISPIFYNLLYEFLV